MMELESLRASLFPNCTGEAVGKCVIARDNSVSELVVEGQFPLTKTIKCPFKDCVCWKLFRDQEIVEHIVKEHGVPVVEGKETELEVDFFSKLNGRTWVPVVFKAFQRDFMIVITEGSALNGITHISAFVFEPPNVTPAYYNVGFALMTDETHADFVVSQKVNPGTNGMLSALMQGNVVYIPSNLLRTHGKSETGVVSCSLKFKIMVRTAAGENGH